MPTHAQKRVVPYTPDQMFGLVADVEAYPRFLPWCLAATITRHEGDAFYADLTIGYKFIRERFSSRVSLDKPHHIHVEYLGGPMRHLSNHWNFTAMASGGCEIDFYIDFAFKNRMFQAIAGVFFTEGLRRMVHAFETRAKELYT